jgi:glutamate-1-semialdehyde 2,1-aminomutase
MNQPSNRKQSLKWYERAAQVIPGGVYGHTSPAASLPITFPYYIERAEGCYLWDVDGNRYLDFMCAYGPIILGHNHPEIEAAANAERKKGGLYSHPSTVMIELAELLVNRIDFAGWSVFGKNGSDMTTWAMQVGRQHTGRKKILVIQGAYHGVDAWTNPSPGGVIEEDRLHIHVFPWNDTQAFIDLVKKHSGQIAAIMINPYHHPAFGPNCYPDPEFVETINKTCKKEGIILILDDVRVGFRIHAAGSHGIFGWEPDMACYCKALGNGYPISATVGKDYLKQSAGKVFLTGSYWNDAVSLAAAKRCLEIIESESIPEKLAGLGHQLISGLEIAAAEFGIKVIGAAPMAAPTLSFEQDQDLRKLQRFSELCAEHGVLFHPHHNWFISAAHTHEAIGEAIEAGRQAFRKMASE